MRIEEFGSRVFNEAAMKQYLKADTYRKLMEIRTELRPMEQDIADEIAGAMKAWALSLGATHYTHWFQPMTGITAEKHDSFLDRSSAGEPIFSFSSKSLIKGEPDASSFPSGGMRETFEARGYTVWDPTSDAFIKDNTLCIPTAFCSYTGAVLDKKTPLMRSMQALNRQALRVLSAIGRPTGYVYPTVGCEQEYFLINKKDYEARRDLILTGRTLFGCTTTKGQILDDHYYGSIRPRVKAYMEELDSELWKLGVYAHTEHNEAAPCQHEMAAVFSVANVAADQNQLVMEAMKKVADRHGFVCLLHEKPFQGINGSGKHNNWSLSTKEGENLLKPSKDPASDTRFLLFLTAVIKGVDDYQDLLRISTATAGNDLRLGGDEAPPAIISISLGSELDGLVQMLVTGETHDVSRGTMFSMNVSALPEVKQDNMDRNRTSPMAFCGSRFEFRMPGSSVNIACTNFMINTAVAESLRQFADVLEAAPDKVQAARQLIRKELADHRRIIFNGNGYGDEWVTEAERRGLANYRSTPEAYSHYGDEKNVELFRRHGILSAEEINARRTIGLEEYGKIVGIEARTMLQMAKKEIVPAVIRFGNDLAAGARSKSFFINEGVDIGYERGILKAISEALKKLEGNQRQMERTLEEIPKGDAREAAAYMQKKLLPLMQEERKVVDSLEEITDKRYWPYPDYTDMLFYV